MWPHIRTQLCATQTDIFCTFTFHSETWICCLHVPQIYVYKYIIPYQPACNMGLCTGVSKAIRNTCRVSVYTATQPHDFIVLELENPLLVRLQYKEHQIYKPRFITKYLHTNLYTALSISTKYFLTQCTSWIRFHVATK